MLCGAAPQSRVGLKEGLRIVRRILATHPSIAHTSESGVTTAELYKLALAEKPSEDFEGWRHLPVQWVEPSPVEPKIKRPRSPRIPERTNIIPNPEHPVRSMSFLKRELLPVLEGSHEIEQVCMKRPINPLVGLDKKGKKKKGRAVPGEPSLELVFAWKAPDPLKIQALRELKSEPEPIGREVGLGADWSHLNRRRENTRKATVYREVGIMRAMDAKEKEVEREARRNGKSSWNSREREATRGEKDTWGSREEGYGRRAGGINTSAEDRSV